MASSLSPRPESSQQRKSGGWARLAARTSGQRPATHEAQVHGERPIQLVVAGLIRAARASGDHAVVAKLYAPIRDALRSSQSEALSPLLETREQQCDGFEDVKHIEYKNQPNRATARALLRAWDADIGTRIQARQALAAQWGLA